jgi:hypothetical protein
VEYDFTALFSKIQELFPFDFATTILGSLKNNELTMVHGVNISFPEEWQHEYMSRNYLQMDSVIRENFATYEVQYWSVTRKMQYRRKEITSLCMDFGMKECYTHTTKTSGTGR